MIVFLSLFVFGFCFFIGEDEIVVDECDIVVYSIVEGGLSKIEGLILVIGGDGWYYEKEVILFIIKMCVVNGVCFGYI